MKVKARAVLAYALATIVVSQASAQNAQSIINLFGGMVGAAMRQAAKSEWERLPSDELACARNAVRRQGWSVEQLIQEGVSPRDPRLSTFLGECDAALSHELKANVECQVTTSYGQITSYCDEDYARSDGRGGFQRISRSDAAAEIGAGRGPTTALFERGDARSRRQEMQSLDRGAIRVPPPNFDCAKAKTNSQFAICRSYRLSLLDSEYGDLYRRARSLDQDKSIGRKAKEIDEIQNACSGQVTCLEANLNSSIVYFAEFLRRQGQTVQTAAERREHERKAAEARAAAEQARQLEEAKARAAAAAAENAKQQASLEKERAEQARKQMEIDLQRKREQAEIEFRDLIHKTFGFAFPILGCVLLGSIFFFAIRRRAKDKEAIEG